MLDLAPVKLIALFFLSLALAAACTTAQKRFKKTVLIGCILLVPITLFSLFPPPKEPPALPTAANVAIVNDQTVFNVWYADYVKQIAALDSVWQKYHRIVKLVRDDDIAILNASIRMDALYEESLAIHQKIEKLTKPQQLAAMNDAQVKEIIQLTQLFSANHHSIVEKSKFILDSQNSQDKKREEIVRQLQQLIVLDAAPQLNIIPHIAQIKENIASASTAKNSI